MILAERIFLVFLLFVLISGCSTDTLPTALRPPSSESKPRPIQESPVTQTNVRAPWELWLESSSPQIAQVDRTMSEGRIWEALNILAQVTKTGASGHEREEALVRHAGTLLKLGRSKEALDHITQFVSNEGIKPEDVSPSVALIVGFAYEHQRDLDQSLAWLSVAVKGRRGDLASRRAQTELSRLLGILPEDAFKKNADRWSGDSIVGPLMQREQQQRAQGVPAGKDVSASWFDPGTYGLGTSGIAGQPPSEWSTGASTLTSQFVPHEGEVVVGVLLPLTGKYASHAENVKRGIELAVEEYNQPGRAAIPVRLVYGDTQGEENQATSEYARLAKDEGVSFVFGPLLAKTSEAVAAKTKEVGVPILTFTKKAGIPEVGTEVFRLGARAEDQVAELIRYAMQSKGVSTFASVVPENESGREFQAAFRQAIQKTSGAKLILESTYFSGDPNSVTGAAQLLKTKADQIGAIFLPDKLESASEIVQQLGNWNGLLLGSALWNDAVAIRAFSSALKNAVFVTPFFSSSSQGEVVEFIERFKHQYNEDPDLLSAQAYDATRVLLSTLRPRAAEDAPSALIQRLSAVSPYVGVTGRLTINAAGDLERRMSVLSLEGGDITEVMFGGVPTGFITPTGSIGNEQEKIQNQIQ